MLLLCTALQIGRGASQQVRIIEEVAEPLMAGAAQQSGNPACLVDVLKREGDVPRLGAADRASPSSAFLRCATTYVDTTCAVRTSQGRSRHRSRGTYNVAVLTYATNGDGMHNHTGFRPLSVAATGNESVVDRVRKTGGRLRLGLRHHMPQA